MLILLLRHLFSLWSLYKLSYSLSQRGCRFLLAMLQYIVQLTMMRKTPNISPHDESLLSSFPAYPDTATRAFQLDGQETIHAVCPNLKCHKIYASTFLDRSSIPIYPTYCSHKEFNKRS